MRLLRVSYCQLWAVDNVTIFPLQSHDNDIMNVVVALDCTGLLQPDHENRISNVGMAFTA